MSITGRIVRGLVRRRVSEPDVMGPVQVEVLEIIESRRIAEPIGDDPPVQCDNRKSSSEKTFTFRASRTWRREYVIQTENMRTEGSSTAVGLDKEIAAKVNTRSNRLCVSHIPEQMSCRRHTKPRSVLLFQQVRESL
jgi:hypothetical protein